MRDQEWRDWEEAQGITAISDGTADLCAHGQYVYWSEVQGVYVHEDTGTACTKVRP